MTPKERLASQERLKKIRAKMDWVDNEWSKIEKELGALNDTQWN